MLHTCEGKLTGNLSLYEHEGVCWHSVSNSMDQIPREANSSWTIRDITCIVWSSKAHYYVDKNPLLALILIQMNTVDALLCK